jgi:hypothetical protein
MSVQMIVKRAAMGGSQAARVAMTVDTDKTSIAALSSCDADIRTLIKLKPEPYLG